MLPCDLSDDQLRAYLGLHSFNESKKESYYSIPIVAAKTPTLNTIRDKEFNDFAIFILKYPAVYSKVVQPICLPQQYEEFYSKKATVVGWGMFKTGSTNSPFLNKVELKISPPVDDNCRLISTIISTNKNGEPQDPCLGDSGKKIGVLLSSKR